MHSNQRSASNVYDVMVVGGGYAGSILAAILARKSYRVVLVERDEQPRFAIGESTTPEQNLMHFHLGRRYNLPFLCSLVDWPHLKAGQPSLPIWPKEAFYFLHNPAEHGGTWHEVVDQTRPFAPDFHIQRGALDLQLIRMAIDAGVDYVGMAKIDAIELDDPVRVHVVVPDRSTTLRARFLADATGGRGLLARELDLADDAPAEYWLRSRSIYAHFLGVQMLEQSARPLSPVAILRSHATMHHLQTDAWTWVIPFDDGVTSVGVVYRADLVSAQEQGNPHQLFSRIVAGNPVLAASMAGAVPIRDFTHTPTLPWRSRRIVGPNWALLGLSGGFVDPLLSPGGAIAIGSVARFCECIDDVLQRGMSAETVLEPMATLMEAELRVHGQLLSCLYATFFDPDRFRAVYRVNIFGRILAETSDVQLLHSKSRYPAKQAALHPDYAALLSRLCSACRPGSTLPSAAQIDQWLHDIDPWAFTTSAYLRPQVDGVFVSNLEYGRRLNRARRSGGRGRDELTPWSRLQFLALQRGGSWLPAAAQPRKLMRRHTRLILRGS